MVALNLRVLATYIWLFPFFIIRGWVTCTVIGFASATITLAIYLPLIITFHLCYFAVNTPSICFPACFLLAQCNRNVFDVFSRNLPNSIPCFIFQSFVLMMTDISEQVANGCYFLIFGQKRSASQCLHLSNIFLI